jgi:hypothetical protein
MYFIVDTFVKVVCFEIGVYFSMFVMPIMMHSCFGAPYIN